MVTTTSAKPIPAETTTATSVIGIPYFTTTVMRKSIRYKLSGYIPSINTYIKEVIYSNPATIVIWSDGTKTVSKCTENDKYVEEIGLTLCILKKVLGATAVKNILDDWVPEQTSFNAQKITLSDVMKKHK